MPTYQYHCEACGYDFENRCSIERRNSVNCPKCSAHASLRPAVVNFSVGWRLTDRSLYGKLGDPKDEYERDV